MALRRSFSKMEHQGIRRKAIVMTMTLVFLVAGIKIALDYWTKASPTHFIKVTMLDQTTFIINQDTTNYAMFASTLQRTVINYRKQFDYSSITIALRLPPVKHSKDIAPVIKIVDAMDVQFDFVAD
jgi:hypothetical protein